MDQSKWLIISAAGLVLVLAGLAYFLVIGRFSSKNNPVPVKTGSVNVASPSPDTLGLAASPSPNAYQVLADKTSPKTQSLPNTGFPGALLLVFSSSAVAVGFGLKKFSR